MLKQGVMEFPRFSGQATTYGCRASLRAPRQTKRSILHPIDVQNGPKENPRIAGYRPTHSTREPPPHSTFCCSRHEEVARLPLPREHYLLGHQIRSRIRLLHPVPRADQPNFAILVVVSLRTCLAPLPPWQAPVAGLPCSAILPQLARSLRRLFSTSAQHRAVPTPGNTPGRCLSTHPSGISAALGVCPSKRSLSS